MQTYQRLTHYYSFCTLQSQLLHTAKIITEISFSDKIPPSSVIVAQVANIVRK